jgi:flavin-dependent dehydrogenase
VTRGRIALVGDASGLVDAVAGDGLALSFCQANSLATALASGDLSTYDVVYCQIGRMPRLMARLLLLMDGKDGLRRRALCTLAAYPLIFSRLLAVHAGVLRPSELTLGVIELALQMLVPRTRLGRRA